MEIAGTRLTDAENRALDAALDARADAIQEAYLANLKIPSVYGEPSEEAPYGPQVARALEHAGQTCRAFGLTCRSLDGRILVAETGDGEQYVCTVAHLDVVPPIGRWTHEPFGAEVIDGVVYGRGAIDDKNGAFASIGAVGVIGDLLTAGTLSLPRRVRVLLGGDEERTMSCVKHYAATQPPPTFAIAPDTTLPCAQAEKGRAAIRVAGDTPAGGPLYVETLAAGSAENVVPDLASAVLAGTEAGLAAAQTVLTDFWDANVAWKPEPAGRLTLTARGRGGHAAEAFRADSAVIRLLRTLRGLPISHPKYWTKILDLADPAGAGLGLADWDPFSAATTSNLGLIRLADRRIEMTFDVRYPVTRSYGWIAERTAGPLSAAGLRRTSMYEVPPLYHAVDGPLIATILEEYDAQIGEGEPAYCTGGRTYASFVPHCVAVGRDHKGPKGGNLHDGDEFYPLAHLRGLTRFLATLLIRLARTPE